MLTLEERFTFESKTNVNFWETKIQSNFLEILFPFQPKNVWHSSSMYMNMSDNCQTLIQFRTVLVTHHPLFPVKQALRHWFRQSKVCQTLPTKAAHFACHQLQQGLLLVGPLQVTGVETGQLAFWQVKVHHRLTRLKTSLVQEIYLKESSWNCCDRVEFSYHLELSEEWGVGQDFPPSWLQKCVIG